MTISDEPKQRATIVQVAQMYYDQELSQQQIADELGVSRSLIALYLKRAREMQIVKIEIRDPLDSCEDIAYQLQSLCKLETVVVVPSSHKSIVLTRRSIAGALARHLEQCLQDGDCLGIGFGRTIGETSELLTPSKPRKIDVVPLLGESAASLIGTYSQANLHVLRIASSFGGSPHFLLTPLLVQSQELRDQLLEDSSIKQVIAYWNRLTHVCMGIGTVPPSQGEVVYLGEENLNTFRAMGGIGDICTRYFDQNGIFIDHELYQRLIGVNVDQLRNARQIIAVTCGQEKAEATIGLLKANLISKLFVDEELAREILYKIKTLDT